jgi:hypothetical protein
LFFGNTWKPTKKPKVKVDSQAKNTHQWEHVELELGLWSPGYPISDLTFKCAAKTSAMENKGRTAVYKSFVHTFSINRWDPNSDPL